MEYHKELEKKLEKLRKENKRLEDENASLWFLLDELEKSNIANPEYRELFEGVYDKLRFQTLMITTSEGEA
jgi:DNA repair ATPase RecN